MRPLLEKVQRGAKKVLMNNNRKVLKARLKFLKKEMESLANNLIDCNKDKEKQDYLIKEFGPFYRHTMKTLGYFILGKLRETNEVEA